MFSVLTCTMFRSRFVFDRSSIPPVVSMSAYSLMESFWLFEGVRRPFRCVLPLPNMEPRRQEFCGPYQQARQVGGRPMCSYTSRSCPFGRHACRTCGRVGWQEAADATRKQRSARTSFNKGCAQVVDPKERWFQTEAAYLQHWNSVHNR